MTDPKPTTGDAIEMLIDASELFADKLQCNNCLLDCCNEPYCLTPARISAARAELAALRRGCKLKADVLTEVTTLRQQLAVKDAEIERLRLIEKAAERVTQIIRLNSYGYTLTRAEYAEFVAALAKEKQ